MTTAIICIALLGTLLFVLGWNVSRLRGSKQTVEQFPPRRTTRSSWPSGRTGTRPSTCQRGDRRYGTDRTHR